MRLTICLFTLMFAALSTGSRSYGDTEFVTYVSDPGFPENGAVDGSTFYVGTPGTPNPAALVAPSKLRKYNLQNGTLVNEWTISGEVLTQPHGLFGIAIDAEGRVYAAEQQGKILRIDPLSGSQTTYVTFPDLHPCSQNPAPCSPTVLDMAPFPNDIVFAPNGDLYVTDNFQATIWKVPAGGGSAEVWYQDARFDGFSGVNGIRFDPTRQYLYLTLSAPGDVMTSGVYRLPVSSPTVNDLQLIQSYIPGPDALSVGVSGKLYVTLPFSNAIVVVDPVTRTEVSRLYGNAQNGLVPVPFDTPTSASFTKKNSLVVTNNSISGNPLTTALLDVYVGENGDPLERPSIP